MIATADASFSKTRTRGATFCVEEEGSDDVEGRKRAVSSFGGATKALMVESVRGFAAPATRDAVRWERRTCLGKVAAALRAERVLSWGMGKDGGVLPWRCQVFELWPVLSCGGRERDERPSNSAHAFLGSRALFLLLGSEKWSLKRNFQTENQGGFQFFNLDLLPTSKMHLHHPSLPCLRDSPLSCSTFPNHPQWVIVQLQYRRKGK